MSPQSHAQQLLTALYRQVLRRARGLRQAWTLEPLPPRRLMSVTPVGGETLSNTAVTGGAQHNVDAAVSSGGVKAFAWETGGVAIADPAVAIRDDGQYVMVWQETNDCLVPREFDGGAVPEATRRDYACAAVAGGRCVAKAARTDDAGAKRSAAPDASAKGHSHPGRRCALPGVKLALISIPIRS